MTAVVITPSLERDWIRLLTTLRGRGIGATVVIADPLSHDEVTRAARGVPPLSDDERDARIKALRATQHALAEHDLPTHVVGPELPLGEQIVSTVQGRAGVLAR